MSGGQLALCQGWIPDAKATPEAHLEWKCLTRVDELRDECGPVESERDIRISSQSARVPFRHPTSQKPADPAVAVAMALRIALTVATRCGSFRPDSELHDLA